MRVQTAIIALYFVANFLTITAVGLAIFWYVESRGPVVDWIDPEGPGYRVLEVTPEAVTVRWIELALVTDCPGRTEISIIGPQPSYIEAYPFLIEPVRRTFDRRYALPPNLASGAYQVRIVDIARCDPLFERRQILTVPFTLPPP